MRNISRIQHKNGTVVWRVRFRLAPGKSSNPVCETFPTREAAIYFRDLVDQLGGAKARAILDTYDDAPAACPTLVEALEEYCEHVAASAALGTPQEYRRVAARSFLHAIPPDTPIAAITRRDIENFIAWYRSRNSQRGTPIKAKTIANAHGLLSAVLQYQVALGALPANPAKGVKIPRDTASRPKVFLPPEQVEQIAEKCGLYGDMVRFLYVTGCRFGEATALTPPDIDITRGIVHITRAWKRGATSWQSYLGAPKSSRSVRDISIPRSMCDRLAPLIEKADPWIFPSMRDPTKPLDNSHFLERIWRKAVAGMNPVPRVHDLRHSHASRLIQEGVPLPVIQARLGHGSIQTTVDIYGHIAPAQAAEVANIFQENYMH